MTADTDLSMIFGDLVVGQNDKEEIFTTLVARIPPRCCPFLLPWSTVTKQPPLSLLARLPTGYCVTWAAVGSGPVSLVAATATGGQNR